MYSGLGGLGSPRSTCFLTGRKFKCSHSCKADVFFYYEVTDVTLTKILKRTSHFKLHLRSFEGSWKIVLHHCTLKMATTDNKQLSYGWLRFRPSWLQFLNTPKWFLFFLSQYFFTQSIIVNGVYPGSISTIERRFGYSRSVRLIVS